MMRKSFEANVGHDLGKSSWYSSRYVNLVNDAQALRKPRTQLERTVTPWLERVTIACEMNSSEELICTECLFENQLDELEPEEAVSTVEVASNGLYPATNELCIASLKANSTHGDLQSTVLLMRDCAYEASVAPFARISRIMDSSI
ncbi:hypothetical protein K1719_040110 [Acacia pycnantha]|nr:hypothetical protein K1719_040110 [Acacia pycnantha]